MQTQLIDEIEKFLADHNLSATRFGVLTAGDTKFVKTLRGSPTRAPRQPREQTAKRVREWMAQYQGTTCQI
jgi:hypothetical protein